MMKNLLENDFILHYGLSASVSVNVVSTSDVDFDLKDKDALICSSGTGDAKYSNPNRKEVNVINYEHFINSLPASFQRGRETCDLIVYTLDLLYFILNELTNTQLKYIPDFTLTDGTPRIGKRNKAISQLIETLNDISSVSTVNSFINQHQIKHCCFFNKQSHAPTAINATVSFNRISSINHNGYKMSNPEIELFGFELWEFSGNQTYLLSVV
jgi:hypothetical protein